MSVHSQRKSVTVNQLGKMKAGGEKIACLTAYDASFAEQLDGAGVEVVLVGDSLGMVVQGLDSTVPVTMDDMVYHTRAVARGNRSALLMADMPFMSYATEEQALVNAARLMQEGGAQMVKLETTEGQIGIIRRLVDAGVPVCAHLGLRPQSVHKLGGYRVQGRDSEAAAAMLEEARELEAAGADCLLLECVPAELARRITEAVGIPVIGIGAGPDTDGQILVLYDILGISKGKRPKFSRDYLTGRGSIGEAIEAYVAEVKQGQFPSVEHSFE
ncbi:MAG: 3-methyl-2-oxobutanoate hydroxymethyltransferase [Pseudomonadota bacterium]